jgi:ubiquitin-protein ligase
MRQAQNRVKKELEEVRRDSGSGVTVEAAEAGEGGGGDGTHFFGVISGPDGTPYQVTHSLTHSLTWSHGHMVT